MHNNSIDLYCKFYVKTELSLDELMAYILTKIGGRREQSTIYTDSVIVGVLRNPDQRNDEDFIYWPYQLDVEPFEDDSTEYTSFVTATKELNSILKANGIDVVVSCDFEDEFK